ncbi:ABC-transporter, subfamily C member 15, partial [Frankliniella occidentalis]
TLTCILAVIAIVELGFAVVNTSSGGNSVLLDFVSPLSKIFTYALAAVLVVLNRIQGMRTSGVLFMFWAVHMVFGAVTTRTHVNRLAREQDLWANGTQPVAREEDPPLFLACSWLVGYPLVVLLFLLNCWADAEPKLSLYAVKIDV